jgi:lipopolysaccharide export system permease protein
VFVTGLAVANQELLLPRVDYYLLENRNDLEGKQSIAVNGAYEPNGTHITGQTAVRKDLAVRKFLCMIPKRQSNETVILQAEEARYIPPGEGKQSGGWMLTDTNPPELENWPRTSSLQMIVPGKYFLRTQQVDFEAVTRQKNWWRFVSTWRLRDEMSKADSSNLANIAVVFHMRLTRPLLGLILVFLGLSVILRDQNRNVFISAGMTVFLGGIYFIVIFACKYLGDHELLWPTLAAWMPVMIFGPMSAAMFDAMHT